MLLRSADVIARRRKSSGRARGRRWSYDKTAG